MTPFILIIYPLVTAEQAGDSRAIIDILRSCSPAFAIDGANATKTLKSMINTSLELVKQLSDLWKSSSVGEVLRFCVTHGIVSVSDRLRQQLDRAPREEIYDAELHVLDKGDWLADALFAMATTEVAAYASYMTKNTAFSTQHGVKGEEYPKVLVVYDDVEAGWNNYNFNKTLTPATAGDPTEAQLGRGRRLAYVSFSRALEDLRILFFTTDPNGARQELIDKKLAEPEQIEIVELAS